MPILLSARRPVREGEGDAGREPGVVGGELAGVVAVEAMIRVPGCPNGFECGQKI